MKGSLGISASVRRVRRLSSASRSWKATRNGGVVLALLAGFLAVGNPADAIHDEGFSLQGDVTSTAPLLDWVDMFDVSATGVATPKANLPSGFLRSGFSRDFVTNLDGTFASGADVSAYATGTKDILPINTPGAGDWQCKQANNVGDKFNLLNAYAAALRQTSGPSATDLII